MNQQERLTIQVNTSRQEYITDGYSMSIGEIVSMYKDGELDINPDYQRKFRWTIPQRSRLIESILIGVPLPSIFVYQNEKGIWEVVDGVQRISTILEFVGELKDENEDKLPPSVLSRTKLLPDLEGITWSKLPKEPLQLDFRRSKIEIKIIKNTSHRNAKFEVFQRLNYAPTILSGQEYRNAVLVMLDKSIFQWLKDLAEDANYVNCIDLTERWVDERYDYELILRLFIFSLYTTGNIYKIDDYLNEYFIYDEDSILNKIRNNEFDLELEKKKFKKVFNLLYQAKGNEVFKKGGRGTQFLESYYEAIAIGLYRNIDDYTEYDVKELSEKITKIDDYIPKAANTSSRIPLTTKFGSEYFKK